LTEGQFEALTFEVNKVITVAPENELIYLIRPITNSLNLLVFTAETVVYLVQTEAEGKSKFTNILSPSSASKS
jgi:hypothetical protein